MQIRLHFPSVLQYGDNVEITGKAGNKSFSFDLLSDYLAFDPVQSDQLTEPDDELPLTETQPLHILFEIAGGWDVNANSPETSTCSHGSSARRFGFCAGQAFTCTIAIRKEFFEVSLNDKSLTSSEHLVPVGSIHALLIDGDSAITAIRYGHPIAIKNSKVPPQTSELSPMECRLTVDGLMYEDCDEETVNSRTTTLNKLSKSTNDLFGCGTLDPMHSNVEFGSLTQLIRAESYQLVFAQEHENDDATTLNRHQFREILHASPAQSKSQQNMLLLDDSQFYLDDADQLELNERHWNRLRRYGPSRFQLHSSLARKAYAKFLDNKKQKVTEAKWSSIQNFVGTKRQANSDQNIRQIRIFDRNFRKPLRSPMQTEVIDNRFITQLVALELVTLPSKKLIVQNPSSRQGDKVKVVLYQTPESLRNSDARTHTFQSVPRQTNAVDKIRPHNIIRQPLSSLDQLWDEVLPHLPLTYATLLVKGEVEQYAPVICSENITTTYAPHLSREADVWLESSVRQNRTSNSTNVDGPTTVTETVCHITGGQSLGTLATVNSSNDAELIENIQQDEERNQTVKLTYQTRDMDHSTEPTQRTTTHTGTCSHYDMPQETCANVPIADRQIAVQTIERTKNLHRTNVSQPVLLIDYNPMNDNLFISDDQTIISQYSTKTPIRTAPRSDKPNATLETNIHMNGTGGRYIKLDLCNQVKLQKFAGDTNSYSTISTNGDTGDNINRFNFSKWNGHSDSTLKCKITSSGPKPQSHDSSKGTIFRSHLPDKKSPFTLNGIKRNNESVTCSQDRHSCAHNSLNVLDHRIATRGTSIENSVQKSDIRQPVKNACQENAHMFDHTRHKTCGSSKELNGHMTVKNNSSSKYQQQTSDHISTIDIEQSACDSSFKQKPQLHIACGDIQSGKENCSAIAKQNRVKNFVHSPRQWISRRFSFVKKRQSPVINQTNTVSSSTVNLS